MHPIRFTLKAMALAAVATFIFPLQSRATPPAGYTQVWADEFNGSALDTSWWSYYNPGPYRDAINTPDAVTVGGGNLTITTYTENGLHYTGFIDTKNKYHPKFGYLEARIRFATVPGSWSAFWTFVDSIGAGADPHNNGVELDIVEHRKMDASGADISNQIPSTLHWDGYAANHKSVTSGLRGTGLATGFHLYAVEWTPTFLKFYIDGTYLYTVNNSTAADPIPPLAPVPQIGEYLMLSSEILDGSWAGNIPAAGYGSKAASTNKMDVDYVRVYQASPAAPATPTGLAVASTNRNGITLSWNMSANAGSYHVKRSTSAVGPFTTIATTGVGYSDNTAVDGVTYYYVVSAVNGTAESANTTTVVSGASVTSDAHSGLYSIKGTLASGTYGAFVQAVNVAAGTTYERSFWLKGSGVVRFLARGPGGTPVLNDQFFTATANWTKYTATFNTGTTTQVNFYLGNAASTGAVVMDDAFLGLPGGTNLLVNPGFESGSAGWSIYQPDTWAVSLNANRHTGVGSLRGQLPGTTSYGSASQVVSVTAGANGQAGLWVKGSGTFRFMVRSGVNGNPLLISQFITATPTWTYYGGTFNTGANTQLTFVLSDTSATSGTVYVDDATLTTGGANLLVNPGFESITSPWSFNPGTAVWRPDQF